jgi:molybdopterin-containing oxidoreductase family iron-sulfur binding subunit
MNRVYIAEAGFSLTGSNADVRLPLTPARLYAITRAIAGKLGVAGVSGDEKLSELEARFVNAAAADLQSAGSEGLVASGGVMPPAGQALVHAINEKLGAIGKTVTLLEDPTVGDISHGQAIAALASEIIGGQFTTVLILGGNPVYDAPMDLNFSAALAKVPVSIHLSLYENETSHACKWHLPRAHFLESWGDARAWDGTAGIVQPLIMPLYEGKSPIEVLAMVTGDSITDGHEIVKRIWAGMLDKTGFDLALRKVIESGLLKGSQFKAADVKLKTQEFPPSAPAANGAYLRFVPDWHAFDGRFANNAWLQETPDPLTKLLWDNAALVSKKDADALGLTTGTMLRIQPAAKYGSRDFQIATYVMPGHPDGVVTLPLGYGREAAGHIGDDLGVNTYQIRTTEGPLLNSGATLSRGVGSYLLVSTQDHYLLDSIGAGGTEKRIGHKDQSGMIVREATLAEFKKDPGCVHGNSKKRRVGLQLFQEPARLDDTHAWGMAIDMNACIGCNACAVACQSENNIPVVGKAQANMHRSMNWIRIDRYFKADEQGAEDPNIEVVYQPMTCQHCENAPCEQVCPVGATVHDTEGINTMIYNRCIGTRYCSNNCPYKVRRFNYLDYQSQDPRQNWAKPYLNIPDQQQLEEVSQIKRMLFNPEVTVRMRGVMEKCTYCVQRIHRTTQAKRAEGKHLVDGDIVTACQQACPTQAIVFGDLNDRNAKVSKLQQNARAFGVLQEELDTRPRTQYLAKIRNPAESYVKSEA